MAFDKPLATITAFCEASSATPEERRCVMHTIFNRQRSGRFGPTIAHVCLKRMQFSEWNGDLADNNNLLRAADAGDDSSVMADCAAAYDEIAAGASDPTSGATHYHDKSIAPPTWTAGATMTLETPKFFFYSNVK